MDNKGVAAWTLWALSGLLWARIKAMPFFHEFLVEYQAFPNGAHDDIINSISSNLDKLAKTKDRYKGNIYGWMKLWLQLNMGKAFTRRNWM